MGPLNAGVKVINWYLSKLYKAAHHGPVPALAFSSGWESARATVECHAPRGPHGVS